MRTAFFNISLSCRSISFSLFNCLFLLQGMFDDPCLEIPLRHVLQIICTIYSNALSDIPRSRAISEFVFIACFYNFNSFLLELFGITGLWFGHDALLCAVCQISLHWPHKSGSRSLKNDEITQWVCWNGLSGSVSRKLGWDVSSLCANRREG